MLKKVFVLFSLCLIPLLANPAYAVNSLQDIDLKSQSATMSFDIEFGQDKVEVMRTKTILTPTLDSLTITLSGEKVDLSDSRLKVYADGKLFSILNTEFGILMYGKYQEESGDYAINTYLATDEGLKKQETTTAVSIPKDKGIQTEIEIQKEEKTQYTPDLMMTSSHDFRTYWKDTFNIDVQAFDGKINSEPKASEFDGRLDGAEVEVLLSLDEVLIASISGVTTNNGHWEGEHFFEENISAPGEYVVDVILKHLGKTISKSSTMFVIATVDGGESSSDDQSPADQGTGGGEGSGNQPPIANAGADDTTNTDTLISLDGTGSSDPDGDKFTYSWIQLSGPVGEFVNTSTSTPDYTPSATGTAVFELTVTDDKGESDTDSVTITVTEPEDSDDKIKPPPSPF